MRPRSWFLAWALTALLIPSVFIFGPPVSARAAVSSTGSRAYDLPSTPFPETTGVDLEGGAPDAAQLDSLRAAGFHWARIALPWASAEKPGGGYDFAAVEALRAELKQRGIEPIFALTAENPAAGRSGSDESRRAAFAAFAGAAARRFHKAVWEIAGPRSLSGFTDLSANPVPFDAWIAAAARAIHGTDSHAVVLAGGGRGLDLAFLQATLSRGAADEIDGIAVHPFRLETPESWTEDLLRLRGLSGRSASRKPLSVWVTGWGYSSDGAGASEERQARYLVRAMLLDYGLDLPATLWYRLGPDVSGDAESGFDLLRPKEKSPSPAYRAAEFMNRYLSGMKLKRVRELPAPLHGLVFTGRRQEINVFWSDAGESSVKVQPRNSPAEGLPAFDLYGETRPGPKGPETTLNLTGSPVYIEGRLEIAGYGP